MGRIKSGWRLGERCDSPKGVGSRLILNVRRNSFVQDTPARLRQESIAGSHNWDSFKNDKALIEKWRALVSHFFAKIILTLRCTISYRRITRPSPCK